jgi:DUF1680 family protein
VKDSASDRTLTAGFTRLLTPILRYVDHIKCQFGPEPGQKRGYPGHQELELAPLKTHSQLSTLDLSSGNSDVDTQSLVELAAFFLDERGKSRPEGHYFDVEARARGLECAETVPAPEGAPRFAYYQANETVHGMKDIDGHSVRAM